jgi:ATP-binding cassette subfamily F protein uup
MSILLSCRNLSKTYGTRPLFDGLTFGLFENERTGLIGPNGSGKSTLLKILAGLETPDAGELSLRRGIRVRYLAQDIAPSASGRTVHDELAASLADLRLEDDELAARVASGLADLGLSGTEPLEKLSGGWRKRIAILSQVIAQPTLLLLDEPTNHLDLAGVRWLEGYLSGLDFSFLVVTHDRRFLEAVCNRVIELNRRFPDGFFSSAGAYSRFVENREAFFETQAAREESMRNIVRREIEWLRRGPKARTTKQKARIDRAGTLQSELSDLEFRNAQTRSVDIDFSSSERRTKRLVQGLQVEKRMGGRKLFGPIDFSLGPGDKLGLLGDNGSGKSTFLKLLAGQLAPDAGSLKRADQLRVVTFDQHREQLDLSLPLRKALCENGDFVHYQGRPIHVAGWAERFLFRHEQLNVPLSRLSGGEQARVLIARLMLRPADLLLLDEPTNDLDIGSLEVLEASLLDFTGAIVLVTHDRFLLDRVSDEILALDGQGGARFFADLSQWEDAQEPADTTVIREPVRAARASVETSKTKSGLSMKELKELKNIEASIRAAESRAKDARRALEDPAIAANAAELSSRQQTVAEIEREIETLMARWETLESRR